LPVSPEKLRATRNEALNAGAIMVKTAPRFLTFNKLGMQRQGPLLTK